MNKFYVYQLRIEGHNQPFYIGKGCGDRATSHTLPCRVKRDHKLIKARTIAKAQANGLQVFSEILKANLKESRAFELERKLIAKFGRRDLGTGILANMTDGGEGGTGPKSKAHRESISRAHLGRPKSAEVRAKVSLSLTGKVRTLESRRKQSLVRQGIAHTHEHVLNNAISKVKKHAIRRSPWFVVFAQTPIVRSVHGKLSSLLDSYVEQAIRIKRTNGLTLYRSNQLVSEAFTKYYESCLRLVCLLPTP